MADTTRIKYSNPSPNYFKRSSRYRIKDDLPIMGLDKEALHTFQNNIEVFEGIDSEIDIYVDTTQHYRYITIFNTEKVEFNESDAAYFKNQFVEIQKANQSPTTKLGEVKAKFKRTSNFVFASYTIPEINIETGYKLNKSIFLITGHSYNLTVFEISDSEFSVEDYLWTTKKVN